MDPLLMINAGTQTADAIAPAKRPERHKEKFGKVLHEKRADRQSDKKTAEHHAQSTCRAQQKQTVARRKEVEKQPSADKPKAVDNDVAVVEAETVQGQTGDAETVNAETVNAVTLKADETAAVAAVQPAVEVDAEEVIPAVQPLERDGSVDASGDAIVADTDDTRLENQQVEAGVAVPLVTSVAAAPEPAVTAVSNNVVEAQSQPQLVDEPRSQIAVSPQAQPVVEVPAAAMVEAAKAVELEESQRSLSAQEDTVAGGDDDTQKVDPRFAALLKPRGGQHQPQPLKDAAQLHNPKVESAQTVAAEPLQSTEVHELKHPVEAVPSSGPAAKQVLEQLTPPGHLQHGQGHVQLPGFEVAKTLPQTPLVQLSNGYQIPESQIFDQVVTQLSGSINGESGRMVLRLQPAELGSLKLELKIEGDRVQAHLHAQTHQVQDVLERNLPQLRSALAEQGLKIDQFLVNVDRHASDGQFDGMMQQHNGDADQQQGWQQPSHEVDEAMIPLAHLIQNGGGGISLHV